MISPTKVHKKIGIYQFFAKFAAESLNRSKNGSKNGS